jgi:hypothetical protein
MPGSPQTWVRKSACLVDLGGGQCIGGEEFVTHHTPQRGHYENGPRLGIEYEVSVMRGTLTVAEACQRRNRNRPVHPAEVGRAGVRYARVQDLRDAGFAVIHTCGRQGEDNPHVSVVWPDANPLDEQERPWPAPVQAAFAACFTER